MCCCILLCFIKTSYGQVLIDSYQISTASADVCSGNGVFIYKNPANITAIDFSRIQLTQILPYSIQSLRTNTFSISHFYKNVKYSFDIVQSGKDYFRTNHFGLTTGINLSKNISLGTKIIYHNEVKLDNFRNSLLTAELGFGQTFSRNFQYGLHLKYNASSTPSEVYKSSLKIGTCYKIEHKLKLYLSIEMIQNGDFSANMAIDYRIQKNIGIRLGWSSLKTAIGSGIVYDLKKYTIEMGTSYHPQLGYSYGMGLGYKLAEIIY